MQLFATEPLLMYGDLIREYREKLGINQGELAERLQVAGLTVTRAAVSHWKRVVTPRPSTTHATF